MKTISPALQALLATREFLWANLFNFSLVDGTQLYYTGADVDINWNSITWSSGGSTGPYFDRKTNKAKARWKIGVEVDTLTFDIAPGSGTIEGAPFITAIQQGILDGAELILHRAYWPAGTAYANPLTPTDAIQNIFVGRVAEVDASRTLVTVNVNSHLELLNQNMPRNLYQSGCLNTLYDSACTLNQASFAVTGTLSSGTASVLNATLSQATGYFDLGKMKFTSGVNNGIWRGVKQYTNGSPSTIALTAPFPQTPSGGDTFTIYPGCDKSQSTCTTKFSNLVNFRGFPYIPDTSTAV